MAAPAERTEHVDEDAACREELESHNQIEDLLGRQDLEAASDWLRCDLNDFIDASYSPMDSSTEDDAYEGSSEAGTDSAESLKVLISSPVKRPSVPLAWQTRIAEIAVFKPANANVFQPSCSPSCSDSVDNKHTLSALQAVAEQQSQIEHVPPASESPAIPSSSTAELSVSKTSHASRELQSVANDTSFLIPASKAQQSDPVLIDQTHDWPCEKATLFPASNRASSCLKTTILQISNSPFKVTSEELLDWLGEEVKDSLPDPSQQIVSVHVLCDRFKGMTKRPAYVEVLDEKIAEKVKNEKWGKEFQGRKIKIAFSSRRAMLCNMFPTWALTELSQAEGVPIVSSFELEGLLALCRLKTPYATSVPERPYMNILSIAAKYPWKARDLLDEGSEEQARVLQAVRDAYKLLKQHGKRYSMFDYLSKLFVTFLESHGGISGSLRPIPVDPSRFSPVRISPKVRHTDFVSATMIHRPVHEPVLLEVASPSASLPIIPEDQNKSAEQIYVNVKSERTFLEYLLHAQRMTAEHSSENVGPFVTPDASPDKILPRSLTSAPIKKGPTLRAHGPEMVTPENLNSLGQLRRENLLFDQEQRAKKKLQHMQTTKEGATHKAVAAPLGKTLSTMSMESQISVNSGNTVGSSPIAVGSVDKLESLFTPPPKFRLQSNSSVRETSSTSSKDQGSKTLGDEGEMYIRDFGMTREEIRKMLLQGRGRDDASY